MSDYTLVIGNKNYSSWSLRPWLAMAVTGLPFEELLIPLDTAKTKEEIGKHSPAGRVPVLKVEDFAIWDSLAILEFLAERHPDANLLPADPRARALCRSISAEMHSGFEALRSSMPMNIRASLPGKGMQEGVQEDINRITAIWRDCRKRFGTGEQSFLFGHFTIADAMYAPVVMRLNTYKPEIGDGARAYCAMITGLDAMKAWSKAAAGEPWIIESEEI
ncbi:MAG: glutathione S-transferase family protein [Alphaproteobacteria bacterium]|nr:glutathione S-transferase family protein [Alphaproteobacteria bacterium]